MVTGGTDRCEESSQQALLLWFSLVPRPKLPQCRSLPVSHVRKEGLGIWPAVTWTFGMSTI